MKIRIREGNDFDVVWAIKRAGVPEDLSTAINMKLTLVVYDLVIEHSLFTVTDNLLSINIPKEVTTVNGDYRLIFEYTLPDAGQPDGDLKCKTDVVPFRIVPFTAKADDIYTINVTSDIAFGFKGDKGDDGDDAYQIWLDLGNEGTYEDFIAYLRQPAVDAGASISELEGAIQVSEGLRVSAESERDLAEATRLQAENERLSAETIRQSNEGNRIDNEAIRVQNEAERISEEGVRQSSEVDRVEAEGIRQSNEIDRIEAEGIRVQAEVERQVTIQDAVTATNLANEKANLANVAAQSANEAAGLADTARTELTTAVNTKLGEADAKIEEMDTTLSTYDGRVTQVESNISQLAGDVSVRLKNHIINSDFVNGLTGWENYTATALSAEGDYLRYTNNSNVAAFMQSNKPTVLGDKWYIRATMKVDDGTALMTAGFGKTGVGTTLLPYISVSATDTILKGVITVNNAAIDGIIFGRSANIGQVIYLKKGVIAINLSGIFGKGAEPNESEFEMLLSLLGASSFEGEITIPAQKVMQWELALIRKNKNAIIALGGTII